MGALVRCITAVLLYGLAACTSENPIYPSLPIKLIVPFPAGGSSDLIARVVSERASRALGQQIVIENRLGAGGKVSTESAARGIPAGELK